MKVRIGAPAYHQMLRAEHAQMLALLAIQFGYDQADAAVEKTGREPWSIDAIHYTHASLLPLGREKVLAQAIDSEADLLLSVDSDTWLDVGTLVRALDLAARLAASDPDVALVGVCVPQDDGRVNAWKKLGERIEAPKKWTPTQVYAIGAAVTIFPLDWHRRMSKVNVKWPNMGYGVAPTGMPHGFIGEDVFMCDAINALEGKVMAIYTGGGVYHAAFASGERPR